MTQHAAWEHNARLMADGKSLEYSCWGPPPKDAPSIVLLHEGLGCVALWRDFPKQLSDATGCGVVAYSRAGYGASDPVSLPRPLDYMSQETVRVLPCLLKALGVEQSVLFGHSDGATIATVYAGTVVDNGLRGLITMAPHFFTEAIALTEIARAKEAYETTDLKQRLAKYHQDADNAFYGWNDAWLHPDFKSWNVTSVIDHIAVPVLAIQGANDQYGTLAQIDALKTRCPSSVGTLILDNCQHAPFQEKTDEVLARVAAFCAELFPKRHATDNSSPVFTPPHAYVPGVTERHPEGYFDSIRHSVFLCLGPEGLSNTDAFTTGLRYLDTGYFWEAHEVLEPVWMALAEGCDERRLVQALIQLANAHLKQRMMRANAARRLCAITQDHLHGIKEPVVMGVAVEPVRRQAINLASSLKDAL